MPWVPLEILRSQQYKNYRKVRKGCAKDAKSINRVRGNSHGFTDKLITYKQMPRIPESVF
jgi:hypothetical protein